MCCAMVAVKHGTDPRISKSRTEDAKTPVQALRIDTASESARDSLCELLGADRCKPCIKLTVRTIPRKSALPWHRAALVSTRLPHG